MRTLRLLLLLPALLVVWTFTMGMGCPNGGTNPEPCEDPVIETTALPVAQLEETYSVTLSVASTGESSFFISDGLLPFGMTFEDGVFGGTPRELGSFPITVELTDECGSVTKDFVIEVEGECPALAFGASALPVGGVGAPYFGDFLVTGGFGLFDVTVTAGELPPGLTLNGAQNVVGTPTTAGTFTFTVAANDECVPVQTITREFTITINEAGDCPLLNLDATPFPNGVVGTLYHQTVSFTGGIARIDIFRSEGTFPPGLDLDLDNNLTGTPTTAGSFTFTLRAEDQCSTEQIDEQEYTIVIEEAAACADTPYMPPVSLPAGEVGVAYPDPIITVVGGESPLSFTLSSGQLPGGLFLVTSTGEIVGTPTGPVGTFPFEITVTDSCDPPRSVTEEFSIQITDGGSSCSPLTLNPLTLEEGTVGTLYEHFFGEWTNGGEGDLSFFSQAPSNPPLGLTLNQDTGTLSGIPTTAGVHQFVLMVTDECDPQQQAFHLITITIN